MRTNIITTTVNGTVIQLPMGDPSFDVGGRYYGGGGPQRLPGFVRGMFSPQRTSQQRGAPEVPTIITTFHGGIATVTRVNPPPSPQPQQQQQIHAARSAEPAADDGQQRPRNTASPTLAIANSSTNSNAFLRADSYAKVDCKGKGNGSATGTDASTSAPLHNRKPRRPDDTL